MERSGVVLAGGKGTRLGADKPLVTVGRVPLVVRAVDALTPLCSEVVVMGGSHPERLADALSPPARAFPDPGEGPLVALVEAARVARGEWLLVAPSDAPHLEAAVYEALFAARGTAGCVAVAEGVSQPLVAVYPRARALRDGAALSAAGERSVRALVCVLGAARLDVDARFVVDIDTPGDLERARADAP